MSNIIIIACAVLAFAIFLVLNLAEFSEIGKQKGQDGSNSSFWVKIRKYLQCFKRWIHYHPQTRKVELSKMRLEQLLSYVYDSFIFIPNYRVNKKYFQFPKFFYFLSLLIAVILPHSWFKIPYLSIPHFLFMLWFVIYSIYFILLIVATVWPALAIIYALIFFLEPITIYTSFSNTLLAFFVGLLISLATILALFVGLSHRSKVKRGSIYSLLGSLFVLAVGLYIIPINIGTATFIEVQQEDKHVENNNSKTENLSLVDTLNDVNALFVRGTKNTLSFSAYFPEDVPGNFDKNASYSAHPPISKAKFYNRIHGSQFQSETNTILILGYIAFFIYQSLSVGLVINLFEERKWLR